MVPRRQLHRALPELATARVGRELLVGRRRANVAPEEAHVGEHDHRLDRALARERRLEKVARAVDRHAVLVVARDEHPRLGGRRLRRRSQRDEQEERGERAACEHRREL